MKSKILLKEIPSSKFHSAIFTTYSLNLYYLEQQVIPLLGGKGIFYISIMADGKMLSDQLKEYSTFSQHKKRNYAMHGMKSNGAFHPKMVFLAGTESLLLLLGSGNLTTSGHGKNLETWNSIYIDNIGDLKLGLVLQAWNYLKDLHADLGDSALSKMKSIEENCTLLSNSLRPELLESYEIDKSATISFLSSNSGTSIFKQLSTIIGGEKIERITVMSPFYDVEGVFLQELNKKFKPAEIHIILQKNFGASPYKMKPKPNMSFFDWADIQKDEHCQRYFHAKNIVFEGKKRNYLVSGSANASVAAFGNLTETGINHESCIIYQSTSNNYIKLLGLNLTKKNVKLKDYLPPITDESNPSEEHHFPVFIKSAEIIFNEVTLLISSKMAIDASTIRLYNVTGKPNFELSTHIAKGDSTIKIAVSHGSSLIYAELLVKATLVSNKQFIIDINAFENNNPSPKNMSLNQIRKLIESGTFSTPKIIDYLNTIYKQREIKNSTLTVGTLKEDQNDLLPEEVESELLYLSYEEIQERAKHLNDIQNPNNYIQYKGVRLWESIFSYLKEIREKENQYKIDEEETEDVNNSSGRDTNEEKKTKKAISKSMFDKLRDKVDRFLCNYDKVLTQKTNDPNADKPSLIDLAMFLIMLEILLHLVSHKEKIEGKEEEVYLLDIGFKFTFSSWSEFMLIFIGKFSMWINKTGGFQDFESAEYRQKLNLYQKMAFKTSICGLSLFGFINDSGHETPVFSRWLSVCLLNVNRALYSKISGEKNVEGFLEFFPKNVLEEFGEGYLGDEIGLNLAFIDNHIQKTLGYVKWDIFEHPQDGYSIIGMVMPNRGSELSLKLFNPGYDWDKDAVNYWNGRYYSVKLQR